MVHHKHQNHQGLRQGGIGNAGHAHELNHAILARVIHVAPSKQAAHVEKDVTGACKSEPRSDLLHPAGVASVRDGPAEGMETEYLQTVQHDQLAVVAPGCEHENVDDKVRQEREVRHVIVPEEDALHVEGVVGVAILIIPGLAIVFIVTAALLTCICLFFRAGIFRLVRVLSVTFSIGSILTILLEQDKTELFHFLHKIVNLTNTI